MAVVQILLQQLPLTKTNGQLDPIKPKLELGA